MLTLAGPLSAQDRRGSERTPRSGDASSDRDGREEPASDSLRPARPARPGTELDQLGRPLSFEAPATKAQRGAVGPIRTPELRMTGLASGVEKVTTSELQMTGLALGAQNITTSELQMIGLALGAQNITTSELQMTGLALGTQNITTAELQMTGLALGVVHMNTSPLLMTGLGSQRTDSKGDTR